MALRQPLFQQNDTTDQQADIGRLLIRDLVNLRGGIVQENAMQVVQRGAGANNSVDVGSGTIIVPGTESGLQGYYHVHNDATVNVAGVAAHGSLPRIDTVVLKVRDSFYSGGNNDAQLLVVSGTAASSPARPDLDALSHENYYRLADISVPANDNTIVTGDITDLRTSSTITPAQGRAVAVGASIPCTSSTRPSGPRVGQEIYEINTGFKQLWNGSAWVNLGNTGAWVEYTPTNVNVTQGFGGYNIGRYYKTGRTVTFQAGFELGFGGDVTGLLGVGLPPHTPFFPTANFLHVVGGWCQDSGGSRYAFSGCIVSTEANRASRFVNAGTILGFGITVPFDWTGGAQLHITGVYEATS